MVFDNEDVFYQNDEELKVQAVQFLGFTGVYSLMQKSFLSKICFSKILRSFLLLYSLKITHLVYCKEKQVILRQYMHYHCAKKQEKGVFMNEHFLENLFDVHQILYRT